MHPLSDATVVAPDEQASAVRAVLGRGGAGLALVVDGGRLVGILTPSDLASRRTPAPLPLPGQRPAARPHERDAA